MSAATLPTPTIWPIARVGPASPSAPGAARAQLNATAGPLQRRRLSLSVVAKPTGAACNLDCQYCFFLSKELLYNASRQLMSEETLETYVAEYLAASGNGEVAMLWQGDEPTLYGLPFFRRSIELCETYRRPAQKVIHTLQTNATLIDEQRAAFLVDNDVLMGVSMDSPPTTHDAYRPNRGGRGTRTMVLRGWGHLVDAGVRRDILCTVHAASQDHGAEVYRCFRGELGATHLQFTPIVERVEPEQLAAAEAGWYADSSIRIPYQQAGSAVTSRSVDPRAYGEFLYAVFDEWVTHDVGRVLVQDIDSALSAMFGIHPTCAHAPGCGNNMALGFNGDVHACDHWVEPERRLDNVADEPFADPARGAAMRRSVIKKSAQLTDQCRRCPVVQLRWGGCPKDRFTRPANGQGGHNYLCAGYGAFYSHITADLLIMVRLLEEGRPPADIMDPGTRRALRSEEEQRTVAVLTTLGAGVLVGVVVGALGAEGGILSVPTLIYLFGQDPHDASAGSLVVVGPTAIISLTAPARAGRVYWRDGATFGLMSVLGALVDSRASVAVDGTVLLTLFCVMPAVVGVVMLLCGLRSRPGADDGESSGTDGVSERRGLLVVAAAATFTGFFTDFLGVGGGFIVAPVLVLALGFPMKEVSGTSLLVMTVASSAGLAARVGTHSNVDWPVVLTFAVASMAGELLGGPLTKQASAPTLTTAFGIPLLDVRTVTAYDLLTA